MIGKQKWSIILEMLWLAHYNPEIDWITSKVKIMRYPEEYEKQQRLKQEKLGWEKQKKEKKKKEKEKIQEEKEWRKEEERKRKPKKGRMIEVKRLAEEWEIQDEGEKVAKLEAEAKELV